MGVVAIALYGSVTRVAKSMVESMAIRGTNARMDGPVKRRGGLVGVGGEKEGEVSE